MEHNVTKRKIKKNITEKQRQYASFYTPQELAQTLTDWAITAPTATVLDPSFGGCAFLYSARNTLTSIGNNKPAKQIFGIDIDPLAWNYLDPLFKDDATNAQFVISDFFDVAPINLMPRLFDAVVGNPPYIRYHNIPDEAEKKAILRLEEFNISLSRRASYWAFFLLYSIQFLRKGGRLAMVLPGSLLHADYSAQVRRYLKSFFREVVIILLEDRIFDGTQEESVLVFADGAREPNERVRIGAVKNIRELPAALQNGNKNTKILKNEARDGEWLRPLLPDSTLSIYDRIAKSDKFLRLGEVVTIRLGVVTGNNDYFILSPKEQEEHQIPDEYVVPIVRRPSQFLGINLNHDDLTTDNRDLKYLLFAIADNSGELGDAVKKYVELGETLKINEGTKCKGRKPWYSVPETFSPDAFVPCMSASWSRLVINRSNYTCTNNILRLIRKDNMPNITWEMISLGMLSSFSQLSAELVGRSYGGGVLKLEPKELQRLVIPILPEDAACRILEQVDIRLRIGLYKEATEIVDKEIVNLDLGLTDNELTKVKEAKNRLFTRRRQHRNDFSKLL
jgi:adenine-specific DNA methylase